MCNFLGLVGYYKRFIKGFFMIATTLMWLLRKDEKFYWSKECQHNFDELKKTLIEAPVLIQPKSRTKYVIFTDASLNGLGCVLM